ncbi:MAG: twin-arginine translocation signal domain-containing protein [Verrucomicrobia bacterium]|nr:twin-arginine translocation signal domain-containing protein [Verrucomicrobiota bacterium]MCF7709084.1 twin-arginine translocation signal domain-containing protein [Verrucomicrobiota bacterium]
MNNEDLHKDHGSDNEDAGHTGQSRRGFLKTLSTGAVAAAGVSTFAPAAQAEFVDNPLPDDLPEKIPHVTIGGVRVPRMFIGSNPIGGWSHAVRNLSLAMPDYFTLDRTVQFIKRCEKAGLDVWLSYWDEKPLKALRILWEQGSKIRPYFLGTIDNQGNLSGAESGMKGNIKDYNPIFYVHHGNVTDFLFRAGKHEQVHDFVKKVHDELGIVAGVSCHNPDCVKYMEDKGWEVDFYQTCLYYITRPKEEIRAKLGTAMLGEPFLEKDRDDMLDVIREVDKPCVAFKLLGAGRLCGSDRSVEEAFAYALSKIKKTDAVIIGMWPKYKDELAQNIRLLARYGQVA